jgi:drug/metabolite transporter (DMT)-like permease
VAALIVWGVSQAANAELLMQAAEGEEPTEITFAWVAGFALLAALLGWGVLALLERFTPHALKIWTIVAVVIFLASLSAPYTSDASSATQNWLALMHLAVAAVLIPGLYRTGRAD